MHDKTYIYGRHALLEALNNTPETLERVYLEDMDDRELISLLGQEKIPVSHYDLKSIPRGVSKEDTHQGFIGVVKLDKLVKNYSEFIETLDIGPDSSLVILGEVQDPQNVGAIIRASAGFGVAGVLIPLHNQAQVNGTVVKVSAGMAFHVPLVSIGNVNDTIRDLKKRGFWIYGLDGEARQSITTEKFDAPTVFILGNESTGIRMKTLELCDVPLVIPMNPQCESLNVAASAAVALYAWSTKHPKAVSRK
ncbi:MAG: 23S rRNA (guanosine(2251)-2'-O)-methyltransferase RlmB [Candidatus Pacebacteria bacterium]|nr:23S rRNA (guanosine(2251)-2'-O)-methyltransferase RlmB [Candidatus Paceibacterota bacterium]